MAKIELHIANPEQCSFLEDPKSPEIRHFETYLPFYEAAKLKRGNANVRPPEPKKRPFKAMMETIEDSPDTFHRKNRGITYFCTDLKYDEATGKLIITIPDAQAEREKGKEPSKFGIADGGHTFEVVSRTVAAEKEYEPIANWTMPCVRVHFFVTKHQENIEPIVEALNTSTQVQQYTLDEYQNKFSSLKVALKAADFDIDQIAFTENEGAKEWGVVEVIQRTACFLPERWAFHQPLNMYKSKNKALKLFTNEETREEFRQIYPVIKDIITLPEFIQSQFSALAGKDRKVGKLNGVKTLKKPWTRPGTDFVTDHKFNTAITLPLAAAFRVLLVKRGDHYEWIRDYREVFEHCEADLYKHLTSKSNKYDLISQISSDIEYWSGATMIVLKAKDELLSSGPIVRKRAPVRTVEETDESQVDMEDNTEEEVEKPARKKAVASDDE